MCKGNLHSKAFSLHLHIKSHETTSFKLKHDKKIDNY
jgi:hypothetical protein